VLQVIGLAIDFATQLMGSEASRHAILVCALMTFIVTTRQIDSRVTQNLVLRDADHYLAGRIGEWRQQDISRQITEERIMEERETPPSIIESLIGDIAARIYDITSMTSPIMIGLWIKKQKCVSFTLVHLEAESTGLFWDPLTFEDMIGIGGSV
jgi:hypothetical protein